MPRPRVLGAVLAGGEGRRFGGPKAEAMLSGRTLVGRAVDTLRSVADDVVVVSSRPLADAPAPVIPDRVEGAGPLAGLDAALHAALDGGYDAVLVVACDLPLLTEGLLRRILDASAGHAAVAPERGGGGVEPLCALYRVSAIPVVAERLGGEDRSLHALFRSLGGHALSPPELGTSPDAFLNVNTPEDRERAEKALDGARAGSAPPTARPAAS